MQFLTDENVAPSVVSALRNAGHDVFDVKERRWLGRSDTVLIAHAAREQRVILTHDKDFTYQEKVPVILLRFRNHAPGNVIRHLLEFLSSPLRKRLRKPVVAVLSEAGVDFHHPYGL